MAKIFEHFEKENIWTANKPMKKCSISLIREMQTKTLRYHYMHIRMAKIKLIILSTDKDVK